MTVISAGITFDDSGEPPWMEPTDITAASSAATLRETMVCSARTKCACTTVTSVARCGVEPPWPPVPRNVTVKRSAAASAAPGRVAKCPAGIVGLVCSPYTASQEKRSNSPSASIAFAPPRPSSASWKMRWTRPAKSRCSANQRAAPSSIAVCPSWPQACITPGCFEA